MGKELAMTVLLKWIFIFFVFKFLWASLKAFLHKKLQDTLKNAGANYQYQDKIRKNTKSNKKDDSIEAEFKVLKNE